MNKTDFTALNSYFKELRKSTPLKREEEKIVIANIKKGDKKALNILIEANLKFVVSTSRHYIGYGLTLPELISAGNMGLIEAANKFNNDNDVKFITYAIWWIRQSILQSLAEDVRVVRLPQNIQNEYMKVKMTLNKLESSAKNEIVTEEMISKSSGISINKVREVIVHGSHSISIDDKISSESDEGETKEIYLPVAIDEPFYEKEETQRKVSKALNSLKDRDREIVAAFYGINREYELGVESIAENFQMSTVRVNQIIRSSKDLMRKALTE